MKKWLTSILVLLMLCPQASADTLDILKPMWLNALEDMQEQKEAGRPEEIKEPKIVSGEDDLEVLRYAIYMDDEYDAEAYVYAELKNTGERVIRVNGAELTVLDASGRQIAKEEYVSAKPDVVMPGESLFVTEWLYDFTSNLEKVDAIQVGIERSEHSRKKIDKLDGVKAYIEGDYLFCELTNTTDAPLYEASVIALAANAEGKIVDMLREETYSNLGIVPGSTVIFRKYLERHAVDISNPVCEAYGYAYGE